MLEEHYQTCEDPRFHPQWWASKANGTGAGIISTAGVNSERDSSVTAAASGTGATRRPDGQKGGLWH